MLISVCESCLQHQNIFSYSFYSNPSQPAHKNASTIISHNYVQLNASFDKYIRLLMIFKLWPIICKSNCFIFFFSHFKIKIIVESNTLQIQIWIVIKLWIFFRSLFSRKVLPDSSFKLLQQRLFQSSSCLYRKWSRNSADQKETYNKLFRKLHCDCDHSQWQLNEPTCRKNECKKPHMRLLKKKKNKHIWSGFKKKSIKFSKNNFFLYISSTNKQWWFNSCNAYAFLMIGMIVGFVIRTVCLSK